MDIEGMSMHMSQTKLMDTVATKVLSMGLDMVGQSGADLIEMMDVSMMETSVNPELGGNLDIRV